ncbi:hypothetical protein C8F01DRAFT_1083227 [Mycena amicta]|nr:hypothetical protein C8F01DRAFT_1083227 [Mycena amicta]
MVSRSRFLNLDLARRPDGNADGRMETPTDTGQTDATGGSCGLDSIGESIWRHPERVMALSQLPSPPHLHAIRNLATSERSIMALRYASQFSALHSVLEFNPSVYSSANMPSDVFPAFQFHNATNRANKDAYRSTTAPPQDDTGFNIQSQLRKHKFFNLVASAAVQAYRNILEGSVSILFGSTRRRGAEAALRFGFEVKGSITML